MTEGKYTMSTTKKGRYVHRTRPYDVQLKKLWRIGDESGRLVVNYRMGHTLQEMGVELKSIDWSRVVVRRSSAWSSSPNASPTRLSPNISPVHSPVHSPSSSPTLPPELEQEDVKPNIRDLQIAAK